MSKNDKTAVAPTGANVPAQKPRDITSIIGSPKMQSEWAKVLPKCLTPERMARVALTQVRKVPKLLECNQESFLTAMMTCAELGIEPNGRHAHLIPYGKECQLIIDYKGLVELAMRSGKISRLHADVVCENDTITIKNGLIDHEINPLKPRGAMVGAYALCQFTDGAEKHEYISKEEVDGIRGRSKAGRSGPWVTDYNEMAKKTSFRRLSKWLPLSPEIFETLDKEADVIDHGRLPMREAYDIQVNESPIESGAILKKAAIAATEVKEDDQNAGGNEVATEALIIDDIMDREQIIEAFKTHEGNAYYYGTIDQELGKKADLTRYDIEEMRRVLVILEEEKTKNVK